MKNDSFNKNDTSMSSCSEDPDTCAKHSQNTADSNCMQNMNDSNRTQNTNSYNRMQDMNGCNRMQNMNGYNRMQNMNNSNRMQNMNGYNRMQNMNNSNRMQNMNGYNRMQNMNGYNRMQNMNGYNRMQNMNNSNRMQNMNNSNRMQNSNNCDCEQISNMSEHKPAKQTGSHKDCGSHMTDSLGRPIPNDTNSLTVGNSGPVLLEDIHLIDKIAHFDRERIPERVVHAKGTGAFGFFKTYQSMADYTMADFLSLPNKITRVFARFSTVIGGRGSADTVRDPRGFAVKFYTEEGIYDLVGNDLPVFFIRDGLKFPDVIHSLKPSPDTNLKNPERFWDFVSLSPEATHMISWLYSDRGTIKNYAKIDGFGVNTFIWVNRNSERFYIKYHWKTMQGLETITRKEADELAGKDPDIAVRTLYNDIKCGNYPKYELCVQIMPIDMADSLDFDPLDDTKTWPEDTFPLYKVGIMVLNENPKNFFAEVEQSAFCPGNLVPGIEFSADKMLQGRSFSYLDTQRYRIGANFMQLPVNRPINPVNNNQRDGNMTYNFNPEPINYSPNSLNNNIPLPARTNVPKPRFVKGYVERAVISKTNDFEQAGMRYHSLSQIDREHLIDNMAVELAKCRNDIVERVLYYIKCASEEWAKGLFEAIQCYKKE